MANTLKFGAGNWATKEGSLLAYNSENGNYKPLPFTFDRASSATRVNKDGLIETVGSGQPRIDYKDDSKGALLLEPSRTNFITYSNDFSQSIYSKINLTITANQGISPDGTQNANLLVPNAAVGNRYLTNSTGSNLKINTVFLKKKELRYVKVGNAQSNVLVDLENGTISADSVSTNNFTIENYGNGWYRVSCYNTLDVNLQIQIFFGIDGSGSNIATNGTDGVYIYGFEIQNGSYATSYIPTQGSAVTRLADSSTNCGAGTNIFSNTSAVWFIDFSRFVYDSSINSKAMALENSSSSEEIMFWFDQPNNTVRFRDALNGNSVIGGYISTLANVRKKVALKIDGTTLRVFADGSQIGSDYTRPTGFDIDKMSLYWSGTNVFDIKFYNTSLTDQELQALTQV